MLQDTSRMGIDVDIDVDVGFDVGVDILMLYCCRIQAGWAGQM